MKIRLHQSDEVIGNNIIPLISDNKRTIVLEIFISKEAVKGMSKGNDIILEV